MGHPFPPEQEAAWAPSHGEVATRRYGKETSPWRAALRGQQQPAGLSTPFCSCPLARRSPAGMATGCLLPLLVSLVPSRAVLLGVRHRELKYGHSSEQCWHWRATQCPLWVCGADSRSPKPTCHPFDFSGETIHKQCSGGSSSMSLNNKGKEIGNGPDILLVDCGHIFAQNLKTINSLGISISILVMETFLVIGRRVWRGRAASSKHFPRQKSKALQPFV